VEREGPLPCSLPQSKTSRFVALPTIKERVYYVINTTIVYDISILLNYTCGPGSSVGIANDYGLDDPRIESRWARFSAPVQTGPGAHPASCTMGTGSFPGVKCGWVVLMTTHPLLMPQSWKSITIPLPTLWATPGL
jgi:hypothetical protein